MNYRILITPEAEADLRMAYRFIRNQGAPVAARKWITGVRKAIKTLANHPERTPLAPEGQALNEPIRELLYGQGERGIYRILYTIVSDCVFVLHVRHGSMLPIRFS